jgi:hypothetical protein
MGKPSNLNTPSITISHLVRTHVVHRTVTNVAMEETYVITGRVGSAVAFEVNPPSMIVNAGVSYRSRLTLRIPVVAKRLPQ